MSNNAKSTADVLFGASAPVSPPSDAASPGPAVSRDVMDTALYGTDAIDGSEQMFPPHVAMRQVLRARQDELIDVLGLTEAQRHTRHREQIAMVRESGLDPYTVGAPLYEAFTNAELATRRGTTVDPTTQAARDEELRRDLRLSYGAAAAEQLLEKTAAFIAGQPRLQRILATPGIAEQPAMRKALEGIIEHVRKQRAR